MKEKLQNPVSLLTVCARSLPLSIFTVFSLFRIVIVEIKMMETNKI